MKNGKPERVTIVAGISDDEHTEIISGDLHSGDKVIIEQTDADSEKAQAMRMRMPR